MITEIHAKPLEKEKLEGFIEPFTSNRPINRKQPDNNSSGPIQKKQASNTNNIRSTLGLVNKQTNNDNKDKKRTLKRL